VAHTEGSLSTGMIPPYKDLLFKKIFGTEENKPLLAALLQAILGLPARAFQDLQLRSPELETGHHTHKAPVLDVRVALAGGEQIDVEVQIGSTFDLKPRVVYYTARMLTEQLHTGDDYNRLGRAITILIMVNPLLDDAGYHHRFQLCEPGTTRVFSDLQQIDTLELSKVPAAGDGTDLWKWMRFIGSRTEQELQMAAELDPVIGEAANVALRWTADDQLRLNLLAQEKAERDYRSGIEHARRQGLAEGLKQGQAEGLKQGEAKAWTSAISRALAKGMSPEEIADLFDISPEEIAQVTPAK
jgi:predicted transposase/invertase (TIGR01784 family)